MLPRAEQFWCVIPAGVLCDVDPTPTSERVSEEQCPSLVLPVTITCAATTLVMLTGLLLKHLVSSASASVSSSWETRASSHLDVLLPTGEKAHEGLQKSEEASFPHT